MKDGRHAIGAHRATSGYVAAEQCVGANYTPEINTSEVTVDFQWHVPRNCHLSVVFPQGLSLVQWIRIGIAQCIFSGLVQWNFAVVISGV